MMEATHEEWMQLIKLLDTLQSQIENNTLTESVDQTLFKQIQCAINEIRFK